MNGLIYFSLLFLHHPPRLYNSLSSGDLFDKILMVCFLVPKQSSDNDSCMSFLFPGSQAERENIARGLKLHQLGREKGKHVIHPVNQTNNKFNQEHKLVIILVLFSSHVFSRE